MNIRSDHLSVIQRFNNNPDCTACPLHAGAQSVCVPSVLYKSGGSDALFVVGQNPGGEEDRVGIPFVGPSGRLLKSLYLAPFYASGLHPTTYLSNAVRCGPTNKVPGRALKNCPPLYLEQDLDRVLDVHERVCVLCTGATALAAISTIKLKSKFSLTAAFGLHPFDISAGRQYKAVIFVTFHPAYVIRFPQQGRTVIDHLKLVRRWFLNEMPVPSKPHRVPMYAPPKKITSSATS